MEKKKGNLWKRILISLGFVAAVVVVLLIVHVLGSRPRETKRFEDLFTKKLKANLTSDVDEFLGWSSDSDDVGGGIAFISRNSEEAAKMYDKRAGRSEFLNGKVEEFITFEKSAPLNTRAYHIYLIAITFSDKTDADEYYKKFADDDEEGLKRGFIRYKYVVGYVPIDFPSFIIEQEDGVYQLGKQVIRVSCMHSDDDERSKVDDIFIDLGLVKPSKVK